MIRTLLFTIFALLIIAVPQSAHAQLRVAATTPDLASVAAAVGGEHVRVEAMVHRSEDPHYVDAKPSYIVRLNRADALLVVGLELEDAWLAGLQSQARNPRIQTGGTGYFDASRHVELMGVPTGRIDRSMGDIHPGGNPHFNLDPRAMARVALALGEHFAGLDRKNEETYRRNAKRYSQELLEFAQESRQRFDALGARRVVTYHKSLMYLADWLRIEVIIELEPRPGIPPNPSHVARVLQQMRQANVSLIVQEDYYPRRTANTVANMVDGRVLLIRGGTDFPDETYLVRMQRLVDQLLEALGS